MYDPTKPGTEYVLWEWTWMDGTHERCVERILPGAFDKALSRPDDVRGLFNHDANQVLGRTAAGTMTLTATAAALMYSIDPGATTVANDVKEHLRRKDVSGSSISFTVDEETWTETKDADGNVSIVREIKSVTMYDTGPVTFPAYTDTTAGVTADPEVVGEGTDEAARSKTAAKGTAGAVSNRAAGQRVAELRAVGDVAEARAALAEFRKGKKPKADPPAGGHAYRARAVAVMEAEIGAE